MCTMTWTEFLDECNEFLKISEKLNDTWSLYKKNENEGNSFLIHKQKITININQPPSDTANQSNEAKSETANQSNEPKSETANQLNNETVNEDDNSEIIEMECHNKESTNSIAIETANEDDTSEIIEMEYHIVYSISYQVPVLYFRAYKSDGSFLELQDSWRLFRSYDENETIRTRADMLSILTQMEHPVLFKPYFALHPCRTSDILAQTGSSSNRVLTFISLMGPYLQIYLNNKYGLLL
ncbi:ubiquitin-like-conjugating enzyme ATG10 [Teleopsis dalmanni]|uniref:ubiquitin-like-conjugating enzyme ATG10 n=1 Tax=Teleopsis dalmanni TaxID=139649 RepID=UPI0018CE9BC1|nr:ubiquitin-like-conjugating enzyme ATG10 [Teleopsis dalmanni]XP_037928706.1 ubiquitin-like-conjugating enzyme ATG10 [Teleopsis dalmanni]XP_037928707.1 ubiquitin-like-conjugating enzyme ATG10 [Teleopsis dalmanni]XP_037951597.1 ubiquitin-like-conjugating enzyme ATG10 [Teleopsis dalmanni]XP_037951598.1 ubiquitin-like-conjugating enzyme ATG10 [Teleopsis dalmanni]XP_037951599.1 ubiquitin-like-conjugating enzyme ATG10 [Teleopsis dalmanni]XP_037954119.1 ubiquitin-like-conjugating enzyme ATG10 [Tel